MSSIAKLLHRAQLELAGVCVRCEAAFAVEGKKRCEACLADDVQRQRRSRGRLSQRSKRVLPRK